jgi:hypothetical protein
MPLTPVDMALTPEEKRLRSRGFAEGTPPEDQVDYPYGLTIHLDARELRRVGFGLNGLNVGDKVNIVGKGMVTSAHADVVNTLETFSAGIQLQSLGLEKVEEEKSPAQTIYGGT